MSLPVYDNVKSKIAFSYIDPAAFFKTSQQTLAGARFETRSAALAAKESRACRATCNTK